MAESAAARSREYFDAEREAVEGFQQIAGLLPEAMLLVTADGWIGEANRSAEELLGAAAAALAGRNLAELTVESPQAVEAYLLSCSRSTGLLPGIFTLKAGRGVLIACRAQGALLRSATKTAPATLLLRFSRKDESLAILAHELRNPLAPLRNGLELLESATGRGGDIPAAGLRTVVGAMKRQVGQLIRLADDLLDAARMTHGRLHVVRQPVSLLAVIERAIESVAPALLDSDQKFVKTLPPASILVDADVARLAQVFVNLLANASKFTQRGGTVQLLTEVDENRAVVRIVDNGVGIRSDVLPRLFEPFVQADQSLARPVAGLGIGLAVAQAIASRHGAKIEAHSAGEGQGSEFLVRMPVLPAAAPDARRRETEDLPHAARGAARSILIVDDNVDAAETLAMLLGFSSHRVEITHSPEAALRTLDSTRPDIILLDIGLPGMDGFELAKLIRARPGMADVLLVAVTGYGREEDRLRAMDAGFDVHLTKPVAFEDLDRLLGIPPRP
jgi:PAS domain S-box-containing protein